MIKLHELKLSDILPERLKTAEILALANALDTQLQEITKAIDEAVIMPRIREQPEDVVDSLAWQLHVDFYEPLGLDLDKKRELVANSLLWHKHKGTKYVVEEMMRTLFCPEFWIEEWFAYGGRPYFFRARIGSQPMSEEYLAEAVHALNTAKNERSWLDYIIFNFEMEPAPMYIGGAMSEATYDLFLEDAPPEEINSAQSHAYALEELITELLFDAQPSGVNTEIYSAITEETLIQEVFN